MVNTHQVLECGSTSWKPKRKCPPCELFSDSVHYYESPLYNPVKMNGDIFAPRYGGHENNPLRKGNSEKEYQQLKPVYISSNSNPNLYYPPI